MRRPLSLPLFLLPLAMLVFSGCSVPVPAQPEPPPEGPEEIFSLPETRRLEPLSAPGIVTEGREPEEGREPDAGSPHGGPGLPRKYDALGL